MPLVLDFKHGDKIIVNGAVLENSGHATQIVVHNDAAILRGKDIVSEEDAVTPAGRAYFAMQCAYIFPDARGRYLDAFRLLLGEYITACPSATSIAVSIEKKLAEGALYGALRATRKLVDHERKLTKELGLTLAGGEDAPEDGSSKGQRSPKR